MTPPNPYGRISELARRLGVEPHAPGKPAALLMPGDDGFYYDVFEVVIRLLDRMDEIGDRTQRR